MEELETTITTTAYVLEDHPQKTIQLPDNVKVDVDERMAEVIVELNRLGIKTVYCCQGDIFEVDGKERTHEGYISISLENLKVDIRKDKLSIYFKPIKDKYYLNRKREIDVLGEKKIR